MFKIEGYEWAIYFLSIFSVMGLGQFLFLKPKSKFKSAYSIVKIVCLIIFVITTIYWIITFPYVGWSYKFSDKENNYSKGIDFESVKNDTDKNRHRIEILERELQETQNNLEAVAGRIELYLQIAMFGLIHLGVGLGVRSLQKDKAENKDSLSEPKG